MSESTIFFGHSAAGIGELEDAAFLKALQWNRQAPPPLAKAARSGDPAAFTRVLTRRRGVAAKGGGGKRVTKAAQKRPSLWSASAFEDSARAAELVRIWQEFDARIKRPRGKKAVQSYRAAKAGKAAKNNWFVAENDLAQWLEGVTAEAPVRPLELLVLCEILLATGRDLAPPLLWALWRSALSGAVELAAPTDLTENLPADQQVVIAGELPFLAGLLFAGIKGSAKFGRDGAKLLAKALLDSTDTDGTPQANLLERLPFWVAGFSRVREWAAAFRHTLWNDEAEERFELLLRAVTPMCRADGTLALSNGFSTNAVPILSTGAAAAGLRKKSGPMRLLGALPSKRGRGKGKKKRPGKRKASRGAQPVARKTGGARPTLQSDWAQLACLRTDWSPQADVLVVAHNGELPQIDLSVSGVPILTGDWPIECSVGGTSVAAAGDWECSCWFSDKDVDFIELQHKTEDGVVIDRQMLLSRKQQFALFADCLSGELEGTISYRSELPVLAETSIDADTETRELICARDGVAFRCYPLSLPCDRAHSAAGRFEAFDGLIALTQEATGGLMAPVVVDWAPTRDQAAEWRKLTVAAEGRALSPAEAAGFRLRVGDLHLLIYRNLNGEEQSRSVLGLHTQHETVVGRFTRKGEIAPLLIVE